MFENLFNAFSSHSNPVTTELVLRAMPAQPHAAVQRAIIPYILMQISCEPGVDISAPMAAALKIVRRPGCYREATISTLMFLTFNTNSGNDGTRLRDKIADELLNKLSTRVRLIRGTLVGVIGHIGRGNNYLNGSAFIGVEKLCAALFGQEYGSSVILDLVPKEESQQVEQVH
jgi:hypothetical protein